MESRSSGPPPRQDRQERPQERAPERSSSPPPPVPVSAPGAVPEAPAPQPAPLPDFSVPSYEPFRYEGALPLTPSDLDIISTFHATYMQGAGIGNDRMKFRQAKRDAEVVLPLLQKQYELACQGVGGANSQEAKQVQRNREWVEALLQLPSA